MANQSSAFSCLFTKRPSVNNDKNNDSLSLLKATTHRYHIINKMEHTPENSMSFDPSQGKSGQNRKTALPSDPSFACIRCWKLKKKCDKNSPQCNRCASYVQYLASCISLSFNQPSPVINTDHTTERGSPASTPNNHPQAER